MSLGWLYCAWNDAHVGAERAWEACRAEPGERTYDAYRAAADREDCGQDALRRASA
jgi:hypothetical protein